MTTEIVYNILIKQKALLYMLYNFKMKMRSKNFPMLPINGIEDDLDSILVLYDALAEARCRAKIDCAMREEMTKGSS